MSVEKQSFGTTKKGEAIVYTVTNKNGMVNESDRFWCDSVCWCRIKTEF